MRPSISGNMKSFHHYFLFFLIITGNSSLDAQNYMVASNGETIPTIHMKRGDSLFKLGKVKLAIPEYRLQNDQKYGICKYELACAYARDGQVDSAFHYLNLNLQYDTTIYALINPDFLSIRNDPRWILFENRWLDSMLHYRPNSIKDLPLAKKLWHMYALDQAYFYEMRMMELNSEVNSKKRDEYLHAKAAINRTNEQEVDSIIDARGWPRISLVGFTAAQAVFLIYIHDGGYIRCNGLDSLEVLSAIGEASKEWYANVFDHVRIKSGRSQLYGTQLRSDAPFGVKEFYPIEDESNVNTRRAEMGMRPIEEYAAMMGVKYEGPVKVTK